MTIGRGSRTPTRARTLAALTIALTALPAAGAWAQGSSAPAPDLSPERFVLPPSGALVTDGDISSIVGGGKRAYLRGTFEHLGFYTGPSVQLDPASGAASPVSARLNGQVSDSVSDGRGGFYLVGGFSLAGDARHANVVHLLPDGSVDPAFTAATNGPVNAVALDGSRLYLGGDFTTVGGAPHTRVGVVDAASGAVLAFAAAAPTRVTDLALTPASGGAAGRLYAASSGGALQGFDAGTGEALTSFRPVLSVAARSLAVGGGIVYVGADGVTALDAATGDPVAGFQRSAFPNTHVHALLLDGDRLIAGGDFGAAYGVGNSLVALDPRTGAVLPGFAPRIAGQVLKGGPSDYSGPGRPDTELDTGVFDLARVDGQLWVGGRFTNAGAPVAENLAVVDAATGARVAKAIPYLGGQVNALSVSSAGRLLVGGNFSLAGARAVSGLAAINATTLAVDPRFGSAGPHNFPGTMLTAPRYLIATRTYGLNYEDNPRFPTESVPVHVRSAITGETVKPGIAPVRNMTGLAIYGKDVILARRLENNVGFPRNVIEIRDPGTGKVKRSFRVPLRGYIQQVYIAPDGSLYLSGSFRRKRANGQQANLAVLRMNPVTGRMYDTFDPHVHGPVYGVSVVGRRIGLSGSFDKLPGRKTPNGYATLDALFGFSLAGPGSPATHLPSLFGPGDPLFQRDITSSPEAEYTGSRRLDIAATYDIQTGGEERAGLLWLTSRPAR